MKKNDHLRVMDYLLEVIEKNKYREDYKLPSEHELQEQFGCALSAAKLALDKLKQKHYVIRRQGRGSFINTEYLKRGEAPADDVQLRIATIIPAPESNFISQITIGIDDYFKAHDMLCHFCFSPHNPAREGEIIRSIYANRFDGILVYCLKSSAPNEELLKLHEKRFPIVLVDRYFKGFDIPTVSCNHFAAGYKITAKFLAMGRSHILYVTEPPTVATTIEHRLNGFKKAIADKNFYKNDCSILYVERSDAFLVELRRFLLAHPETDAVITTSGQLSSLTLRGLKSLGREPGTDILFAVFDEEMLSAERVNEFPYLQINQNPREIGSSAARILHDILRGTMQKKNKNLLIPSELVPKNDAADLFGA